MLWRRMLTMLIRMLRWRLIARTLTSIGMTMGIGTTTTSQGKGS